MLIRPFRREIDEPLVRACVAELQAVERELDARLPRPDGMVDAYVELLLRRCAEWDGCILVAEAEDGAPVGMATVYAHVPATEPDEPAGTFALLNDLVVLPHGRRRGAAQALLLAAEAFATRRGAPVLRLEVMAGNEPAFAFYRRAGFRERLVQMEKPLHTAVPAVQDPGAV
jgi:ribosomal protein S18 acetylase RimI-like enzyme